jgi:hypothetical protein
VALREKEEREGADREEKERGEMRRQTLLFLCQMSASQKVGLQ